MIFSLNFTAKTSAYGELYAGVNIEDLIILADRVKIGQSIRNLICNALKFTPVSGTVVVSGNYCF